jgi:hypothetical protein
MHTLWNICVRYWPDAVLALAFALIVDLFRVGSRLREGWRWVKDKYAESSIAALNRRIAEQGKYRNTLQSYLDSDKASYLAMLRAIIGMLVLMCSAGLLLILERKTAENGDGKRGKRGKTGGKTGTGYPFTFRRAGNGSAVLLWGGASLLRTEPLPDLLFPSRDSNGARLNCSHASRTASIPRPINHFALPLHPCLAIHPLCFSQGVQALNSSEGGIDQDWFF